MTRMRAARRGTIALGSVLAAAVAATIASTNQTGPSAASSVPGDIEWRPCDADLSAQCGTLEVPLDWSDPGGETIELALTRRPAEDPDQRIGALVLNFGGPGSPGALLVQHAHQTLTELFSEDIRERFDLVGFDPRGVGNSHPIRCSQELLDQLPDPILKSQRDFDQLVAYNERLRADCRARNGPLADHVDTLSVVHDLDAIRAALGEQTLTYYGLSYGTHIGQQYAEEYPDRVRALALDSNVDHSLDTQRWVETKAEMLQAAFDEFVSWCEADRRCPLAGADVRGVWHDLLDQADRGRLPGRFDSYDLVQAVFNCAYGPEWSELAGFLQALNAGGPQPDAPCLGEDEPPPVEVVDPLALSIVNFCSDYALPVEDYREWRSLVTRAGREYAPDVRVNPNAVQRIAHCLGQDTDIPNPQHELDVSGTAPLLLGNSLYDPVTGHNLAVNADRQMGEHSVLLTYEGGGHGVYGSFSDSDCVTEIFDDYLINTQLPPPGTRCPAVPYEPS